MHWLNEPAQWSQEPGLLAVTAEPGTDFWRTTSYGYVRDNGHLYGDLLAGDFDLAMRVSGGSSLCSHTRTSRTPLRPTTIRRGRFS